jgi:hypothetical protein
MMKLFRFIKNNWLLILVILVVVLYVLNGVIQPKGDVPTSTLKTDQVASYREIVPGSTDIDKVNELLGFPKEIGSEDGKDIYDYETSNQFINHRVISEGGIVKLVKEGVNIEDEKTADSIRETYGDALYVLFEQAPSGVFNLYVYPENGIAYLGHADGTLLEVWYFEPTSIHDFIARWASNYSEAEYTKKPQY